MHFEKKKQIELALNQSLFYRSINLFEISNPKLAQWIVVVFHMFCTSPLPYITRIVISKIPTRKSRSGMILTNIVFYWCWIEVYLLRFMIIYFPASRGWQ